MKLSLELLFSYLMEAEPSVQNSFKIFSPPDIDFTECRISHIKFLINAEGMNDKETIWFVEEKNLRAVAGDKLDGIHVVTCADDDFCLELENYGCICINMQDYSSMLLMFNAFMDRFKTILAWDKDTELIIARKEPIRRILERSENIIRNPVFIWDDSFNILGQPTYDVPEMPLWQKWMKLGYIPGDGVAQFAKLGYFNNSYEYSFQQPISPLIFNYPFVLRLYTEGLHKQIILAQYFVHVPCTPAQMELLNLLEKKINSYISAVMATEKREKSLIYEPFLADIIQGRYTEEEIKDKLKYINLPFEARYKVYAISFERYTKPLSVYVKRAMKQLAPAGHAIALDHTVYLFNKETARNAAEQDEFREKLNKLLENSSCFCGESDEVSKLSDVKAAAMQCTSAIQMGAVIQPERRYWKYRDLYAYDMMFNYYEHMNADYGCMIHPGLHELIRNDMENGNDNLKLLGIFLNRDRNITNTAKEMFLHRNTVIYRIGKIEQLLGVSLDDPEVRFDLLVSLKCIELRRCMEAEHKV